MQLKLRNYTFFYKKLGSAPSTKSFLIGFLFSEAKLPHCLDVEDFWMEINTKRALL